MGVKQRLSEKQINNDWKHQMCNFCDLTGYSDWDNERSDDIVTTEDEKVRQRNTRKGAILAVTYTDNAIIMSFRGNFALSADKKN
jgi:hypothetical protein